MRILPVAALPLLATACLSLSQDITVNADGSGSLTSRVDLSEELLSLMTLSGEAEFVNEQSVRDACVQMLEGLADEASEQAANSGVARSSTEITATDDECFSVYSEAWPAGQSPSDAAIALLVDDHTYRMELSMLGPDDESAGGMTDSDGLEEMRALGILDGAAQLTLKISLPGTAAVDEDGNYVTNADSVDGAVFLWEMGLEDIYDAPDVLYAESVTKDESPLVLMRVLIAMSVVLLIAVSAAVIIARLERRRAAATS